MATGLMNFINQPNAASPLIQPTPMGIGGMGLAGPAGRGSFGGPSRVSKPNFIDSLARGIMMSQPTEYTRSYPNVLGRVMQGLGAGMNIHQQGLNLRRQAAHQDRMAGLEWAKIQNQISESALRRRMLEAELDEARRGRTRETQQVAARKTMLEGMGLDPATVESMQYGGDDYKQFMQQRFAPGAGDWGEEQVRTLQDGSVQRFQKGPQGQIRVISTTEPPGVGGRMFGPEQERTLQDGSIQRFQVANDGQVRVISTTDPPDMPDQDEPLGTIGARRMINNAGEHPPVEWTAKQAQEAGFRVANAAEQNRMIALRGSRQVLSQLENMMLSEEPTEQEGTQGKRGLAYGNRPNVWGQTLSRLDAFVEGYAQSDPRYAEYDSFAQGTVVPLVRSLGEVGNLSQTEVQRGINLIPRVHDTPDVVRSKLNNLTTMLDKWVKRGSDARWEGDRTRDEGTVEDGGDTETSMTAEEFAEFINSEGTETFGTTSRTDREIMGLE